MTDSAAAAAFQSSRSFAYLSVDTTDAYKHSVAVSECEHVYQQVQRGPFRGRISELMLGPVHILRDQVSNPIGYVGPSWVDAHVFFSYLPSSGTAFVHGRQVAQNTVVEYPRDHLYRAFCNGPTDCVAISIREDAIAGQLTKLVGEKVSHLNDAMYVPQTDCVDRFQRGAVGLLSQVSAAPHLLEDEVWRQAAQDRMLEILLEVVHLGLSAPHKLPPASTRSYIVDKAIEYMHSNVACLPGELAGVCRALRVSPRTLRYSFEEVVGVSPVHYLLSLRLSRVRQELVDGGGANGIHRVAQRHGFGHMGRFALFYQQAFGEKPSDTSRRASADGPKSRTKPTRWLFPGS
jgi:AraC family ethanolamine operon transcriptional activator